MISRNVQFCLKTTNDRLKTSEAEQADKQRQSELGATKPDQAAKRSDQSAAAKCGG